MKKAQSVIFSQLEQLCRMRCREVYGQILHEKIEDRLSKELSIIEEMHLAPGFLEEYDKKQRTDPGSFICIGGMGGSFVAFLLGLTKIDPLPPHYICRSCHQIGFYTYEDEVLHFGDMGSDLPDRQCPECGSLMAKSGSDIPCESVYGTTYAGKIYFEPQPLSGGQVMLNELIRRTGTDPVPEDLTSDENNKIMSLFADVDELGICPEQIGGITVGTLGTDDEQIRYLLAKIRPRRSSDVMRIFCLEESAGYPFELPSERIKEKENALHECITDPEDVFLYLTHNQVSSIVAQKIMGAVRKGKFAKGIKVLSDPDIKELEDRNIPESYIDELYKVSYLPSKSYACEQTLMMWKLLYFKLYHAAEFYRCYIEFSCFAEDRGYSVREMISKGYDYIKDKAEIIMNLDPAHMNIGNMRLLNDLLVMMEISARGIEICSLI